LEFLHWHVSEHGLLKGAKRGKVLAWHVFPGTRAHLPRRGKLA